MKFLCDDCGRPSFKLKYYSWDTGPGSGRFGNFCKKCLPNQPEGWDKQMGISNTSSGSSEFVNFVGNPRITDSKYGDNAFGSVLSLHSNGDKLGVICGHGGSAWLCLKCAEDIEITV